MWFIRKSIAMSFWLVISQVFFLSSKLGNVDCYSLPIKLQLIKNYNRFLSVSTQLAIIPHWQYSQAVLIFQNLLVAVCNPKTNHCLYVRVVTFKIFNP